MVSKKSSEMIGWYFIDGGGRGIEYESPRLS